MSKQHALQVSGNLALPADVVTLTTAALGIRGSGKTNTAGVFTEELLKAGHQVIILDPLNVWWGLKSSADGKSDGYPVVILGGPRGDLPLSESDGRTVADFLAENRAPAILSMRHLTKSAQRRFVTDFAEQFYHRKGEAGRNTPVLLVVDEASLFVPQHVTGDSARMVGAIQSWVRQGRASGIGVMLVDQRPATVNKDVLSQIELMIVHRLISPQDRKALREWIDAHATEEQQDAFNDTVATLARGEAWFWSPEWLDLFKRVGVRARATFDSSATPKLGTAAAVPVKLARVELETLKGKLAATIERAKADDPATLKKEIAELRKHLAAKPAAAPVVPPKEIPVVTAEDLKRLESIEAHLAEGFNAITAYASELQAFRGVVSDVIVAAKRFGPGAVRAPVPLPRPAASRSPSSPPPSPSPSPRAGATDASLGKCERAILTVLAQHPDGCEKGKLTLLAGYTYSGGFRNSLAKLRTAQYIDGDNEKTMTITDAGLEALGNFEPLPTGEKLIEHWLNFRHFGKCEQAVLKALVGVYPGGMAAADLCSATGYDYSGGFRNALSALRTAGVIDGRNTDVMKASAVLFG